MESVDWIAELKRLKREFLILARRGTPYAATLIYQPLRGGNKGFAPRVIRAMKTIPREALLLPHEGLELPDAYRGRRESSGVWTSTDSPTQFAIRIVTKGKRRRLDELMADAGRLFRLSRQRPLSPSNPTWSWQILTRNDANVDGPSCDASGNVRVWLASLFELAWMGAERFPFTAPRYTWILDGGRIIPAESSDEFLASWNIDRTEISHGCWFSTIDGVAHASAEAVKLWLEWSVDDNAADDQPASAVVNKPPPIPTETPKHDDPDTFIWDEKPYPIGDLLRPTAKRILMTLRQAHAKNKTMTSHSVLVENAWGKNRGDIEGNNVDPFLTAIRRFFRANDLCLNIRAWTWENERRYRLVTIDPDSPRQTVPNKQKEGVPTR